MTMQSVGKRLLILASIVPLSSWAAEQSLASEDIEVIEVLGRDSEKHFATYTYSATKTAADILDLPQSISAVTKELIQQQGLMRLNDVTPFVSGASEFSVYNDITIRGFRSQDDRRLNGMRTYNDFWSQTAIAHVERVEVIKGPASAIFGDASPGGVINTVTKKPLATSRHELSARIGSYQEKYVALDTTGAANQSESILYRLNVGYEDSESFRNQAFNKGLLVSPSVTFLASDTLKLNLEFVYSDSEGILERGQPNIRGSQQLGAVPIEVSATQPGDHLDTESLISSLAVDYRFSDSWWLAVQYMHQDSDQDLIEHGIGNYVDGSDSVVNLRYIDRNSEAESDSFSSYLNGNFYTGNIEHNVVIGYDYIDRFRESSQRVANNAIQFDILNPVYQRRDTASYNATQRPVFGGNLQSEGIYIQDRIVLGQWSLLASLREERFDLDNTGGGSSKDSQLLPRLGTVYKLSDTQSVYASWMQGFEPPPLYSNNPEQGGPFKPQDSELYEAGFKARLFNDNLQITTAIYQITRENVVLYDAEASAKIDFARYMYRQRGAERARGFEFDLNGQLSEQFSIIANYAYNSAKVTKDLNDSEIGKRKEGAAKHMATIWSRYQFNDNWSVGIGANYVGERPTSSEGLLLPSYVLYNAGIYYQADDWKASLVVDNLFDKVHWTGGYSYSQLFPGDPRSASLAINYRF
ncbi:MULTISPECIES: TonB-dependent receptor [Pseudoalteromonas]|uniref:TonB-dependent siderophore receptor n=1 Tax=Pseudoalteromonas TaxID=53246 RepID=UPI001F4F3106|nr:MULTISPECIES: TonB-dependent receptor [Pseudoalteromonas]MDW7550791.1 TonB-dependent receptor [Pseudoalteromonas peptidolytica]